MTAAETVGRFRHSRSRGEEVSGRGAEQRVFTIVARGPFSLEESATFGFGQRAADNFDGVMRLAFCLDDYRGQVGVEVRQDANGVQARSWGMVTSRRSATRWRGCSPSTTTGLISSKWVGAIPVIGRLQASAPGLRPPQFYSPYEAAAWSIISARRPATQMAEVRRRLSETHGRVFELAGQSLAAFPTPERLLAVDGFPGLTEEKVDRLHGVADAALQGQLGVDRLRAMDPQEAMADLQRIKGIGPFCSSLIVVRACGLADVLPTTEPKLLALTARLYGLPGPPTPAEFEGIAAKWRPFRTWAAVLIRAVAARLT